MKKSKQLLTRASLLKCFDAKKETTLQVDASQFGMGTMLLHKGQPIAYALRSLTETEQKYPQIDKELLAIVFGCQRLHSYIYDRLIKV